MIIISKGKSYHNINNTQTTHTPLYHSISNECRDQFKIIQWRNNISRVFVETNNAVTVRTENYRLQCSQNHFETFPLAIIEYTLQLML